MFASCHALDSLWKCSDTSMHLIRGEGTSIFFRLYGVSRGDYLEAQICQVIVGMPVLREWPESINTLESRGRSKITNCGLGRWTLSSRLSDGECKTPGWDSDVTPSTRNSEGTRRAQHDVHWRLTVTREIVSYMQLDHEAGVHQWRRTSASW